MKSFLLQFSCAVLLFCAAVEANAYYGPYGYQYEYQYQYQTPYGYQYQYEYQYETPGITFTDSVTAASTFAVGDRLAKSSGSFVIDHPLDPANMLLYHSFVESPDAKNIYDGVAELDENGEAVIELPDYFMALGGDYRYQEKGLSAPMPGLYIKEEIADKRFTIAGGIAGGRVSWQVSAIRHDPYILAHPIVPEVVKGDPTNPFLIEKGDYLYPGYKDATRWEKIKRFFSRL